jgi:hypothetical protein
MPMNFERSLLTETIISFLRGVNDEITYVAIAQHAGVTVKRMKSSLPSARRALERENIEFAPIHGLALRRMNEIAKAHKSEAYKQRISRAAYRAEKHAAAIDLERLPPSDQVMVTINRTTFSAIRRQAQAKVEAVEVPKVEAPSTDTSNLVNLIKNNS